MQNSRLSASDLERIAEILCATESAWRSARPSTPATHFAEDTGWFTAEELRPPGPAPIPGPERKKP